MMNRNVNAARSASNRNKKLQSSTSQQEGVGLPRDGEEEKSLIYISTFRSEQHLRAIAL